MVWRRIPAALPNFPLTLLPLSEAQRQAFSKGLLSKLTFRTVPSVNKAEIKAFLESVYGLSVARVSTCNYEGPKKRSKSGHFYRKPDYKKAFVVLKQTEQS